MYSFLQRSWYWLVALDLRGLFKREMTTLCSVKETQSATQILTYALRNTPSFRSGLGKLTWIPNHHAIWQYRASTTLATAAGIQCLVSLGCDDSCWDSWTNWSDAQSPRSNPKWIAPYQVMLTWWFGLVVWKSGNQRFQQIDYKKENKLSQIK